MVFKCCFGIGWGYPCPTITVGKCKLIRGPYLKNKIMISLLVGQGYPRYGCLDPQIPRDSKWEISFGMFWVFVGIPDVYS